MRLALHYPYGKWVALQSIGDEKTQYPIRFRKIPDPCAALLDNQRHSTPSTRDLCGTFYQETARSLEDIFVLKGMEWSSEYPWEAMWSS